MKEDKSKRALVVGIINFFLPIPMFVFSVLWCWLWFFGIGMGVMGYEKVHDWILYIGEFPLIISPVLSLFGIVYGIIKIKEKHALIGILLSVLSLLINVVIFAGIWYLGRF